MTFYASNVRVPSGLAVALLALSSSLSVSGCRFGVVTALFVEPSDEFTEIPASEMDWIVRTVLEAEQLDCDIAPEGQLNDYRATALFYEHTCIRPAIGESLNVWYRTYDSGAELRIHTSSTGGLLRPKAPFKRSVRRLKAGFEAADLTAREFSPNR